MKKWETINKLKVENGKLKVNEIIKLLLENRGIKTKKEIEEFLEPKLEKVNVKSVGIDEKQLKKAVNRIQKAIKNKEQIVVFGDYDVDGICSTAILWETIHGTGANVTPYIPHRIEEGYGLSIKGISNIKNAKSQPKADRPLDEKTKDTTLIITVDNGIVANEAVKFANEKGIDVIITDHHVPSNSGLPDALAIVHTTKLCGAGVAWALAQEFKVQSSKFKNRDEKDNKEMLKQVQHDNNEERHLELVALATIADMVPLTGANRTLVKFGLKALKKTKRAGLIELFKEAALDPEQIGVYEVGHIIAPRLNAMGRLEYAMDSLRLLCTKDRLRAQVLADKLGMTNKERQEVTNNTSNHAKDGVRNNESGIKNLLFVAHETYQPGVIGLVAGKLVEEFYRPSIVVSIGEKYSKASARSVHGFNIIEFIRGSSELLIDCGGHPMAAGFTVETEKLEILQTVFEKRAIELLNDEMLKRVLKIDCEIPLSIIDDDLYREIQKLAPFGMGNPEPTFVSKGAAIEDMRLVGYEKKHLKLRVESGELKIEGIGFGLGEKASEIHIGDKVDIVYIIDENAWNGNKDLQLKVKDIKKQSKN
ncbi:MAG: single-stranded-DNA-specific exonuclease RecJ [Candidatus Levybacteria bacterium]|nr:single-stranded-DNA-specific exonuclease RecJ [Candidatus Levybacteria bacterium]